MTTFALVLVCGAVVERGWQAAGQWADLRAFDRQTAAIERAIVQAAVASRLERLVAASRVQVPRLAPTRLAVTRAA